MLHRRGRDLAARAITLLLLLASTLNDIFILLYGFEQFFNLVLLRENTLSRHILFLQFLLLFVFLVDIETLLLEVLEDEVHAISRVVGKQYAEDPWLLEVYFPPADREEVWVVEIPLDIVNRGKSAP